jgi:hypothetical protein
MTSETETRGKKLSSNGSSTTSGRLTADNPITAENYLAYAKAFGRTFLIARAHGWIGDLEYHAMPREWGAWLWYFLRKQISVALMGVRDYCQVPSRWPYEFDPAATIVEAQLAADDFERGFVPGARSRILIPKPEGGFIVKQAATVRQREAYVLFPQLWDAFTGDPVIIPKLNSGLRWDVLNRAASLLATQGPQAAGDFLAVQFAPPLGLIAQGVLAGFPVARRQPTPQSHLAEQEPPQLPRDLGEFPERLLETELMRQA